MDDLGYKAIGAAAFLVILVIVIVLVAYALGC